MAWHKLISNPSRIRGISCQLQFSWLKHTVGWYTGYSYIHITSKFKTCNKLTLQSSSWQKKKKKKMVNWGCKRKIEKQQLLLLDIILIILGWEGPNKRGRNNRIRGSSEGEVTEDEESNSPREGKRCLVKHVFQYPSQHRRVFL